MQRHKIIKPVFILLISSVFIFGQVLMAQIRGGYSAIVFKENKKVIAKDCYGKIIKQGKAYVDDADVIQKAVYSLTPAGELKIASGKYFLNKPILINNNIELAGEGRGTILVPPLNDYAIKIEKTNNKNFYRPYHEEANYPLYAMMICKLTIDGKRKNLTHSGKGIYLHYFWSSSFENLWIQNTGNALTLDSIKESNFRDIYLIDNGSEKNKEPGVFIRGGNNLHFSGLYVIYQNYIGMKMQRGRLIFITQSTFHSWLEEAGYANKHPAKFPEIIVKDFNKGSDDNRYKTDVVIENSRITVGGEGTSVIDIIDSPVTIRQCVATCGVCKAVISATENSRINVLDNSFYSLQPLPSGTYVFYGEDSEVIFRNNQVSYKNLQVCLKGMRNSIIADNRFQAVSKAPNVYIGNVEGKDCSNIQVRGNIFRQDKLEDAVKVEPNSHNIKIYDNQLWS